MKPSPRVILYSCRPIRIDHGLGRIEPAVRDAMEPGP